MSDFKNIANLTWHKGRIMKGRVVVTGMGAVTPLGLDDSSWAGICDTRCGGD